MEKHMQRTPGPADLQPDAEQPDANQNSAGETKRPIGCPSARCQRRQDHQAAAAAAADKIAGGPPIPINLMPRFRLGLISAHDFLSQI